MPATTPTNAQNSPLVSDAHTVLACPKSPCGRSIKRDDQHDERDDGLVDGIDAAGEALPRRELGRDAEHEPAGERAVRAADPAEHDGGEDREEQLEAEVRVERALDEAGEHPGETGERRPR